MTAHSGLRSAGRDHSREMASDQELNHTGAAGRIGAAQPDPAEPNGAPDDGFTGTWCENVAYVRGAADGEVPQRIYNAWTDSPSHNRCMNNGTMTVAGVGMYYESSTNKWWATLELAEDRTLPGSTPQTAEPSPTVPIRTEPPERTEPPLLELRTEPPEPTPQPTTSPVATEGSRAGVDVTSATTTVDEAVGAAAEAAVVGANQAASAAELGGAAVPSTAHATFGWLELAATLAVLALVGELLRRISRRRDA
ncbi:MAG: CAP domain-containing protein [Actinomycetota bacterium]